MLSERPCSVSRVLLLRLLVRSLCADGSRMWATYFIQGLGYERHGVDGAPWESSPLAMMAATGGSYTEHAQV